jgi:hypothetical protein
MVQIKVEIERRMTTRSHGVGVGWHEKKVMWKSDRSRYCDEE